MSDNAEVVVRRAKAEDAGMLRDHCFTANSIDAVEAMLNDDLKRWEEGEGIHLVAEIEGVVIGSATLIRDAHALRRHRATIYGVVVNAAHQKRGVARRLIEGLREHAAGMGISILEISARGGTPAETVYRRLGFAEWGRIPNGLIEPWGDRLAFDETHFWMPVGDDPVSRVNHEE